MGLTSNFQSEDSISKETLKLYNILAFTLVPPIINPDKNQAKKIFGVFEEINVSTEIDQFKTI